MNWIINLSISLPVQCASREIPPTVALRVVRIRCHNISQYYCFYCIFNQINAALVSIRDVFQKKKVKTKILIIPNFWPVVYVIIFSVSVLVCNWYSCLYMYQIVPKDRATSYQHTSHHCL